MTEILDLVPHIDRSRSRSTSKQPVAEMFKPIVPGLWVICISLLLGLVTGISRSNDNCVFTLVESIPENFTYPSGTHLSLSTYAAHKRLLSLAVKTVHIASFYWTLRGSDVPYSDYSSFEGEDVFKSLEGAAKSKTVDLKIAQNNVNNDTDLLRTIGAEVRTLNFTRLIGSGVLHTKMWVVDDKHLYVGSANLDWRSYTQVKELGILVENCQEIVSDAGKIFDIYWYLGLPNAVVPKTWPAIYSTSINSTSPLVVHYNNSNALVYMSSSPPPFCSTGRTKDIDAILDVIFAAREFIYISVMDFLPLIIYIHPQKFWPVIDDALRKVAFEKRIKVYVMVGCWKHTVYDMLGFLKSLDDIRNVKDVDLHVKYFNVPIKTPSQAKIPFSRVNHAKYMVTDQHAYIGTSNWSGDYFISTGGVGFIIQHAKRNRTHNGSDFRQQLEDAFLRDWSSDYTSYYCNMTQV